MAHNGASGQTRTKKYISIYTVNFYHSIQPSPVTRSNFCTSERRLTLCLGGDPSELDSNSCWLITVAPDELAAVRSCRPVGRAPLDGPDSCTHTESHFKPCRHVSLSPVFRAKNRHDGGSQSAAVVSFPIQKLISNRKSFALGCFFFPVVMAVSTRAFFICKAGRKTVTAVAANFVLIHFQKLCVRVIFRRGEQQKVNGPICDL